MPYKINKISIYFGIIFLLLLYFSQNLEAQIVGAPSLVSPANGSTGEPNSLTLQWSAVTAATSYSVQVATDNTFTNIIVNQTGLSNTSYQISGLSNGTTYYWRVGDYTLLLFSGWSSAWSFTTSTPPPPSLTAPTLVSPADGSTGQPTTLTFSWNSAANATSYHLQVSTSSTFATIFYDNSTLTSTSQQVSSLLNSTTYYWRVSASNSTSTSSWSSTWSLTTTAPPPPPSLTPPALANPLNGASNQPTTMILSWHKVNGSNYYWLQIATDESFSNPTIGDSSITDTTYQTNILQASTTYYWRVKSKDSLTISNWSTVWSFSTVSAQTQPPAQPVLVSPADSAANLPVLITFTWNPVANADHYYIQVATDQTFSNMVYTNYSVVGSSLQISGLSYNTKYYWQVKALNAGGESQWSNQWTFTTSSPPPPPTLAVPVLVNPANGLVGQSTNLVFTWNSVSNATLYHLQVSTSSLFNSLIFDDSTLSKTSQQITSLSNNTLYYWRVRASNSSGTGNWSDAWSFTTLPASLITPALISPADDVTSSPNNVIFSWNAVPNSIRYHFQLSTSPTFNVLIADDSLITQTSDTISSLPVNQLFLWRVKAIGSNTTSQWSPSRSIKTSSNQPPTTLAAPNLTSPPNGAVNQQTNLTLSWSSVSGATSYSLQVALDQSFTNLIVNQSGMTSTSYNVTGLLSGTTYYWRAGASTLVLFSGWSNSWNFTTAASVITLSPPTLSSPANGAVDQPLNLTLAWNIVSNADSYHLQLSTNSSFNTLVADDSNLTQTTYPLSRPLGANQTYYWRVSAENTSTNSSWSNVWSFTTSSNSLASPQNLYPANGAVNQPVTIHLGWNSISGSNSYILQIATDSSFKSIILFQSGITNTSDPVSGLLNNTIYYWHVKAVNNTDSSAYSSVWNFKTAGDSSSSVPSVPSLLTPANNSSDQPLYPILNWNTSLNSVYYRLQVSTDNSFKNVIFDDSVITSTYYQVGPLNQAKEYYWHVRASNNSGYSDWSVTWDFITQSSISNVPVLILPVDGAKNLPLSVNFTWDSLANTQFYELQVSNSPNFDSLFYDDSTILYTSVLVRDLNNNTNYFWRVRAKINGNWEPYTSSWQFSTRIATATFIKIDTTYAFPSYSNISQFKSTDYRIIGLPGAGNLLISSLLDGQPGQDWIAYWDNGAAVNYLKIFDGSSNFNFSEGTAFWILKNGALNIDTTVESAPIDNTGMTQISLHQGWNLITNPFIGVIPWPQIQSVNNTNEIIYSFSGTFNTSVNFNPYVGYYFFNSNGAGTLRIPVPGPSPIIQKKIVSILDPENQLDWKINIKLETEGLTDSSAWFGVSNKVNNNYNLFDVHKPSYFGSAPSVYFYHPEWDKDYSIFASDIKPESNSYAEWNFQTHSTVMNEAAISFSGINKIPDRFEVYLVNANSKQVVNLRQQKTLRYIPVSSITNFKIMVGTSESLKGKLPANTEIRTFDLGNAYPNPFNNSTIIPITIPEITNVQITVYNILGEKVKSLYHGQIEPGEYDLRWDGTNNSGDVVSSGIYFYRLTTQTNLMITKKMILLK